MDHFPFADITCANLEIARLRKYDAELQARIIALTLERNAALATLGKVRGALGE